MESAPLPDITIDLRGLHNPEPILRLAVAATSWRPFDTIRVLADDRCFANDFLRWCVGSQLDLLSLTYPSNGDTELTVRVPRGGRSFST